LGLPSFVPNGVDLGLLIASNGNGIRKQPQKNTKKSAFRGGGDATIFEIKKQKEKSIQVKMSLNCKKLWPKIK